MGAKGVKGLYFTEQFIKGLKPKKQHYIVREGAPRGQGGFCIRVLKSGAKTWQFVYSFEGVRKWLSLGEYPAMNLSRAREAFRAKREILASGKDPGEVTRGSARERREAWTVEKLADEFIKKYSKPKKRPRSAREDELNLKRDVKPAWGSKKARDIRRGDVVVLLDGIEGRGAKIQANRTLATIRKMFAWALEREVVEFNPAAGISKPAVETPRERALSHEEIKSIWVSIDANEEAPEGIKRALKLILLTGCRPGEVLSAQWDQVEGKWIHWPGTGTKNKRPHRAYISDLAKKIMGTGESGLILANEGAQIPVYSLSSWVRRCRYFGIDPWTPHDLRRTCSTRLAEMGTQPHVIDRVLNHVQTGITARVYDQYSYSVEIEQALESWGQKVENLVFGGQPGKVIQFAR